MLTLLFWFSASAYVKALSIEEQLQDANGNSTILTGTRISGWTSSPSFRGTGDILWSCLVTIVAAIYTAVHPDIPARHESQWQRFRTRVNWAFTTLLAPEMMLRIAMKQFLSARALLKQLNNTDAKDDAVTTAPAKKYNMAYAFYIEMGGFVVDTSHISNEHPLVALTANGAKYLAKAGHVFEIDLDQLADRSKSGTFGKVLVCFQISWMFLQCVARASAGYPLTLLEIHTMTHVVCAILIYILWWHKPNDVGESQLWDAKGFEDVIALLVMSESTLPHSEDCSDSELETLRLSSSVDMSPEAIVNTTISNQDRKLKIKVGQYLPCGIGPGEGSRYLDTKDLERWRLTAEALRRVELVPQSSSQHSDLESISHSYSQGIATAQHAKNTSGHEWQIWDPFSTFNMICDSWTGGSEGSVFLVAVLFLPLIYGGVHLTAWNFQFPSFVEDCLWKSCSIVIMSVGPATLLIILLVTHDFFANLASELIVIVIVVIECSLILFTICRFYLVVESFISLRNLPLGAFATTPWLQAIPHI